MKVTPLTDREWREARRRIVEDLADDVLADRIEATVGHGFAPDEPTPAELDQWAGESIMGWHQTDLGWHDGRARPVHALRGWQPSRYLTQALECVMETDIDVSIQLSDNGRGSKGARVWRRHPGASDLLYPKEVRDLAPFDPEAIAEAIMRHLHAELAE